MPSDASNRPRPALDVQYPADSPSPVAPLFHAVSDAMKRIAPERADDYEERTSGHVLSIVPADRWLCDTQFGAIQISTRAVEITWAFCYATWVYYTKVVMGTMPAGEVVDLSSRTDVHPALALLTWALDAMQTEGDPFWPGELPHPAVTPAFASDEHVADELTLVTLAFFLHHELAHTYLNPGDPGEELAHEQACDGAAAEWILGTSGLPPDVRAKRALGVAIGLLLITAFGVHTGQFDGVVHPYGFVRLVDTLESQVPPDEETVWAAAVAVLALHSTASGLPAPTGHFSTFHEAARAYRDLLMSVAESGTPKGV